MKLYLLLYSEKFNFNEVKIKWEENMKSLHETSDMVDIIKATNEKLASDKQRLEKVT